MRTTVHGIRDGMLFLAGLIVFILVIFIITDQARDTGSYRFKIRYLRAQGIAKDAVVQVSGVPEGHVEDVSLGADNRSLVTVAINRRTVLHCTDTFSIAAGGLVGENYIDIVPAGKDSPRVEDGDVVLGISPTSTDDLFAATGNLLTKLDASASALNHFLGDQESTTRLRRTLENLDATANAAAKLTETLNGAIADNRGMLTATLGDLQRSSHSTAALTAGMASLMQRHQADLDAAVVGIRETSTNSAELLAAFKKMLDRNAEHVEQMVTDLNAVTKDLRQISASLTPQMAGTKAIANLDAASEHMVKISEKIEHTAAAVDVLVNDPALSATLQSSLKHLGAASADLATLAADARKATALLPEAMGDMKASTANLREASVGLKGASNDLPLMTRPIRDIMPDAARHLLSISKQLDQASTDVSGATHTLTNLRGLFSSLRVTPDARALLLTGGSQRARADVNVNVQGNTSLLRVGVANLDRGNQVNAQLGGLLLPNLWVRGGIVQSKPGVGMDFFPGRDLRLSGELFAPRSARANVSADYRLYGPWWLTAGWYDMFRGPQSAAGVGVTFRP